MRHTPILAGLALLVLGAHGAHAQRGTAPAPASGAVAPRPPANSQSPLEMQLAPYTEASSLTLDPAVVAAALVFDLTPGAAEVPDRGRVAMRNPHGTQQDAQGTTVTFAPPHVHPAAAPGVDATLYVEKGKRYALDFLVPTSCPSGASCSIVPYYLFLPAAGMVMVQVNPAQPHARRSYTASETGWVTFRLRGPMGRLWGFRRLRVSPSP